jgi:hypothetical protein
VSALLKMNVSPRAALAIVVLAACVSLVAAGREAPAPAPPPAPAANAPERAAPRERALDLDKLERPGLGEPLANLFATPRAAAPAARAARPATTPPPAPVAPPLPFRYLGRYVEGGRSAVYLARGDEPLLAAPGAALGAEYRVEEVSPAAVTLIYVPLGTRQRLPLPPPD